MDDCGSNNSSCNNNFLRINAYLLLTSIILYVINQLFLKVYFSFFILHYYLNDFIAMILLLSFSNFLLIKFRFNQYCLDDFLRIHFFALAVGLFWEFITPIYRSNSTTDVIDLLIYLFSGSIYYTIYKLHST